MGGKARRDLSQASERERNETMQDRERKGQEKKKELQAIPRQFPQSNLATRKSNKEERERRLFGTGAMGGGGGCVWKNVDG